MAFLAIIATGLFFLFWWDVIGLALLILVGLFVFLGVVQNAGPVAAIAAIFAMIALYVAASWSREWRHSPAGQRDWPALRAGLIVAVVLTVMWATGNRQQQAHPANGGSFSEEFFHKGPDALSTTVNKPGDAQWCAKWRASAPCQDL